MATISNTPRPGYVFDVTDNVWYPIGVGGHSHSEIAKTIADAKGDLIVGTAADTVDRLAVGNNGETLVADSAATSGLRYQSAYNGNGIINGAMDIWQRGTTFTTTSGVAYTCDRWSSHTISAGGSVTTSRQTVSDTTNLPTIQYATKFQRVAANTNTGILSFFNTLESADSYRFAGQIVTLSFYAKKGANYSAASDILVSNVVTGTGTDQIMYNFTGTTNQTQNNTLTTTWQRFSQTVTVASSTTEIATQFYFTPVGTAGADDSVSITGVQLELGSVATTFKRSNGSGGTIQGELAACQRYYYLHSTGSGKGVAMGTYYSSSDMRAFVGLPVTMRTTPTLSAGSGTNYYRIISAGISTDYFNSFTLEAGYAQTAIIQNSTEVSGTAGYAGIVSCESGANSFVAFSAEL